jgi:glycosyltransferase involved in cell wall biosynthesis
VLWVTQVYPRFEDDVMGAFLHRLARELPARGFALHVLAPGSDEAPEEETRDGVRVVRFRYARPGQQTLAYSGELHRRALRRPLRFASFVRSFRRAVREQIAAVRPALVHAHWWVPSGWVAARPAVDGGLPFLVSLHGTDVRLLRRLPGARRAAASVLAKAVRVLPVSEALEREIAGIVPDAGRREVLPMPADDTLFQPREDAGTVTPDGPSFVIAARLTRQKRVDVAVRAMQALAERGRPGVLHIAGDGPERPSLERLAGELDLAERVVFHGTVRSAEVASLFATATAVLLPSVEEGYGLVIVEAALCGTPSIGTDSGGIRDLIRPEETGLLVPPLDAAALASAMARLAGNPELASRLGRSARDAAAGRTSAPIADRLAALYRACAPA